jgi:hypothetical protein
MAISQGGATQWLSPSLPFATIGSGERATARVTDSRIPAVAYLICAFVDSIEIWPLCAIAFPRWGVMRSGDSLRVGKAEITFYHSHDEPTRDSPRDKSIAPSTMPIRHDKPFSAISGHPPNPTRIVICCFGMCRYKTLRRRVTIMGEDHPSTLRLYGFGLTACSHAIIAVNGSVWLMDLTFPEAKSEEQWAMPLALTPQSLGRGQATIAADWGPTARGLLEPIKEAPPIRDGNDFSSSQAALQAPGPPVGKTLAISSYRSLPTVTNLKLSGNDGVSETPLNSQNPVDPERVSSAETLATRITDRLGSIQKSKSIKRRILSVICIFVVLLVILPLLWWPIIRLMLPLINDGA